MTNESNSAKSKNGYNLNAIVKEKLEIKLTNKEINSYENEPRYAYPGYAKGQFSPDGEVIKKNGEKIVFDNTTTARHDRFKQKQWDANGIKTSLKGENVKYFIIVPDFENIGNDSTREKEIKNVINEKVKIHSMGYFSQIDDILTVSEFMEYLN
ncbi:MAG: hypothetical protein ACRC1T_04760 [Clostridium chrysemydis]|uniref:hypothetical protein n=1 Tax=Clostridium chrysemydis TaxID=2665504 RepID=UPI003F3726CB